MNPWPRRTDRAFTSALAILGTLARPPFRAFLRAVTAGVLVTVRQG